MHTICAHAPARTGHSITTLMECVRGLAALWVFLFHIPDLVKTSLPTLYPLALAGHRGVPVFFVVSGYCIFAAAERCLQRQSDARVFLQRRLMRIFPTFWISILVVLVLPYTLEALSALKTGSMRWPAPRWLDYSALDWLAIASLTKELADVPLGHAHGYTLVNSVYWTLGIELQFYLVMYVAITLRRHWPVFLALVSLCSFVVVGLAWLPWPGLFLQFWPAFLCGVVLRLAYSHGFSPQAIAASASMPRAATWMLSVAGICAVAAWLARFGAGLGFLGTAFAAALLLWCLGGIEHAAFEHGRGRPRAARLATMAALPFLMLGECSYSLYLLHGKLYQLPGMLVRQALPLDSPWHLPCVIAGTVVLCYGFYLAVERRYQAGTASAAAAAGARA